MDAAGLSPRNPDLLRIGLTGGIGSGKSTVAGVLRELGAAVVDTDRIARELTLPGGAAIAPIAQAFGSKLLDPSGALHRARMRELVFADASAKQRLEAILHPLIGIETARQADAAGDVAAIVFDVPLLVESAHWRGRVDKILVVDCSESTQVGRVVARSGWSADAVRAVIAGQATRARRRAAADAVIDSDTIALAALTAQVAALWQHWMAPLPRG